MQELTTYCFEEPGPQNTDATLQIALTRAKTLGIRQMVVASSHGDTARKAHALCQPEGIEVIAVTIAHSWEDVGWCMSAETKEELRGQGIAVLSGIHALGDGVASAFTEKHGGRAPEEIVRDTLYLFCQGIKVAVECIVMAADAGLLEMEREVIGVAGTSSGADTAIVCKPAYARTFLQFEIREILAKPRVP
jgi:hypothetical protein